MERDSVGVIVLVFALILFFNTMNNSQAPNTTSKEVNRGVETKMFKTTFDPWPTEGFGQNNAQLAITYNKKTLATFPVGSEGTANVDFRALHPPPQSARTKVNGCSLHISAYTPLDLRYRWAEFRMANKQGAEKGVVFGKSDAASGLQRTSTTFAVLVASSTGSVEGKYICGDDEFPAKLSLRKGVNYIHLDGSNNPFTADRTVIASQKIAYGNPSVVDLKNP